EDSTARAMVIEPETPRKMFWKMFSGFMAFPLIQAQATARHRAISTVTQCRRDPAPAMFRGLYVRGTARSATHKTATEQSTGAMRGISLGPDDDYMPPRFCRSISSHQRLEPVGYTLGKLYTGVRYASGIRYEAGL